MTARLNFGSEIKVLFSAKISIATVTTTTIGSDLNLAATAAFVSGMRLIVMFDATTAGTTDTTSFGILDAPDNAGSIGTPVAINTAAPSNLASPSTSLLAGGTGDRLAIASVLLTAGRPWLRLTATRAAGTTDTTVVRGLILGVPQGLL